MHPSNLIIFYSKSIFGYLSKKYRTVLFWRGVWLIRWQCLLLHSRNCGSKHFQIATHGSVYTHTHTHTCMLAHTTESKMAFLKERAHVRLRTEGKCSVTHSEAQIPDTSLSSQIGERKGETESLRVSKMVDMGIPALSHWTNFTLESSASRDHSTFQRFCSGCKVINVVPSFVGKGANSQEPVLIINSCFVLEW